MIKRIIFDLDNTLIMWKDKYLEAIKETVELYHLDIDYKYLSSLVDEYDDCFKYYDKELMVDFINKKINNKIDINFLNTFLDKFSFMSEKDDKVIEVLEYLSKKYELVVLTNWFTNSQKERLKNADILKYFKEVIGGEKHMKPYKEAFISACGEFQRNECMMIGDNYNKDIIGAYNIGLDVIYFNYNNKNNNIKKIKEIKNIKELEDIL